MKSIEGFTKNQVKQIIKIASSRSLTGRDNLKGLLYDAPNKSYLVTDGFAGCVWQMQKSEEERSAFPKEAVIIDEYLPETSGRISVNKLKEWTAIAKAKDICSWQWLKNNIEEDQIPSVNIVLEHEVLSEETGLFDPKLVAGVLPLFEGDVAIGIVNNKSYEQAKAIRIRKLSGDYPTELFIPQVAVVMGKSK